MYLARIAWLGSLFLILGAFYFEFARGMQPCQLCLYQRIPHYFALIFGGGLILFGKEKLYAIIGIILFAGTAIAFFHVGVEAHWWEGLKSCSASGSAQSVEELLDTPVARCDEVPWRFLGLSMAAWNALFSLLFGMMWIMASRQRLG